MKNSYSQKLLLMILPALVNFISVSAAPRVGSVTVGNGAPSTITSGNSSNYLITVNRGSGQGSNGSFSATFSVTTALPAGVTATFTPSTVSFSGSANSATATLTLS